MELRPWAPEHLRLVVIFLEKGRTANEESPKNSNSFWKRSADQTIGSNGFPRLCLRVRSAIVAWKTQQALSVLDTSGTDISARQPKKIDVEAPNKAFIEIEETIESAKKKHNSFLKELGLSPLP
jgi:predicted sulfurtransferase